MKLVGRSSLFGSILKEIEQAPAFSRGVRCLATNDVAVPDQGCGHRIKLWLIDGEGLRCVGGKCPRFPGELRRMGIE